jgi:hypothetical protein
LPPAGNVIFVDPSQTGNLTSIVSGANQGDTILFADGTYPLNGVYLWVSTPGLTIRSASGNREAVILDGNYQTTEIIHVTASHVTIADLTICGGAAGIPWWKETSSSTMPGVWALGS